MYTTENLGEIMQLQEIEQKIKEVISNQLGKKLDEIQLKTDLVNDLGADSLDSVEIIMALEDVFPIKIADDQISNLSTLEDLVNLVSACLQNQSQQGG